MRHLAIKALVNAHHHHAYHHDFIKTLSLYKSLGSLYDSEDTANSKLGTTRYFSF